MSIAGLLTPAQNTLSYGCLCGNNQQPNVSEYTMTLPYYVCTEWGNQCVQSCGDDNTCSAACRQDHPCGAQVPKSNSTTTASSSQPTSTAATTSANEIFTGIAGATATASPSNDGQVSAAALAFGRGWGLAVVAGGLFAGFALML